MKSKKRNQKSFSEMLDYALWEHDKYDNVYLGRYHGKSYICVYPNAEKKEDIHPDFMVKIIVPESNEDLDPFEGHVEFNFGALWTCSNDNMLTGRCDNARIKDKEAFSILLYRYDHNSGDQPDVRVFVTVSDEKPSKKNKNKEKSGKSW